LDLCLIELQENDLIEQTVNLVQLPSFFILYEAGGQMEIELFVNATRLFLCPSFVGQMKLHFVKIRGKIMESAAEKSRWKAQLLTYKLGL
jgi:hypothetical protein